MSQFSVEELEHLLRVNPKIAVENTNVIRLFIQRILVRFRPWLAYTGIVFKRLNPKDFSDDDFRYAQEHLRFTSFATVYFVR